MSSPLYHCAMLSVHPQSSNDWLKLTFWPDFCREILALSNSCPFVLYSLHIILVAGVLMCIHTGHAVNTSQRFISTAIFQYAMLAKLSKTITTVGSWQVGYIFMAQLNSLTIVSTVLFQLAWLARFPKLLDNTMYQLLWSLCSTEAQSR